ncbi:MAG TPA: TIGR04255 family protein, partial [Planctomycetota bacterium]|nr:TIGR04255 family protein [Planctomycetota bacterium]
MATWPHLKNAPIVEAVVDLRTSSRDGAVIGDLSPLEERLRDRYPMRQEAKNYVARVELGERQTTAETRSAGFDVLLKSSDGFQIARLGLGGFSFSRLRPYTDWTDVRTEAKSLWEEYVKAMRPAGVFRLAVRYIN